MRRFLSLISIISLLFLNINFAFAESPSRTNDQLIEYGFGAGGTTNSASTNFSAFGTAGEVEFGLPGSANYKAGLGLTFTMQANTPGAPTLTTPGNNYDRVKIVIDTAGNSSDTTYAIAISIDNFATDTRYVKSDKSIGNTLESSDFLSYNEWGGASGSFIWGLESGTNYYVKVKARDKGTTEKTFGDTNSNYVDDALYGLNEIEAKKFTLLENGKASSISIRAKRYGSQDSIFRLLIYDDDGTDGYPGTLKAYTAEHTLTAADNTYSWHTENIIGGPILLPAGDYYIVHQWKQGQGTIAYDANLGYYNGTGYYKNHTYNTIPTDPFPASGSDWALAEAKYVTYTSTTNFTESGFGPIANITTFEPSLSFGLDTSNINFNNLNAANSYTDSSKQTILTTSTNAYSGYIVYGKETQPLTYEEKTITDYSGTNETPTTWTGTGFGYNTSDASLDTGPGLANRFTGSKYAGFTTLTQDPIVDHTSIVESSPISNETFTVSYRVTSPSDQEGGNYTNSIIYTIVPIY